MRSTKTTETASAPRTPAARMGPSRMTERASSTASANTPAAPATSI